MDVLNCIINRRSIRRFKNQNIEIQKVEDILKAAMYAPTARNQQTFEFVVINNRQMLDDISEIHPYANMLKQAPLAILVCHNHQKVKSDGFWIQDLAAVTQNILLQAYSLGIGSVWLGVYPREDRENGLKKYLNLPEDIVPFSLVALGYADENPHTTNRYDSNKIHFNRW
ncbi:MAG TPA: nitroreductase family protein [Bacteroidales bacterium]|nr:MAG: NADH dehydrogenase [Bacteroidetes bacterium GWF2_33_38]OFY68105.1 MAG: NADH dehydrogenase [Bacteroidetes bacterium RIFOXYA12_FULL_33_9]HBF88674.1 nitroreductase family protein [Bacteroidales bacterium]